MIKFGDKKELNNLVIDFFTVLMLKDYIPASEDAYGESGYKVQYQNGENSSIGDFTGLVGLKNRIEDKDYNKLIDFFENKKADDIVFNINNKDKEQYIDTLVLILTENKNDFGEDLGIEIVLAKYIKRKVNGKDSIDYFRLIEGDIVEIKNQGFVHLKGKIDKKDYERTNAWWQMNSGYYLDILENGDPYYKDLFEKVYNKENYDENKDLEINLYQYIIREDDLEYLINEIEFGIFLQKEHKGNVKINYCGRKEKGLKETKIYKDIIYKNKNDSKINISFINMSKDKINEELKNYYIKK